MKLNFETLERMVTAGATAAVLLAAIKPMFEAIEFNKKERKPKDATRYQQRKAVKRIIPPVESGGTQGNKVEVSEIARNEATLSDTPRARLFREGAGALLALSITDGRARALIAQWLKFTNDDDQLVLATILRARDLAIADAPGWILASLKGKVGNARTRDDRSVGRATERNAEQGFAFGPKPSLVPAGGGEGIVRLLPEGRSG